MDTKVKIFENWRKYKRLADQQILAESLVDREKEFYQEPGDGSVEQYRERFIDHELMMKIIGNLEEQSDNAGILAAIESDDWEDPNPESFLSSLVSGMRGDFLTPYSVQELSSMRLYKLPGINVGFAIKPDGDIVSVHNNSGVAGIGTALMAAAIRNGGSKLDHFDGFLTGFYNANGFSQVAGTDAWNDEYAPKGWKYEKVNIFDPRTSIYAKELSKYDNYSEIPPALKAKIQSYENGKPDIVYRVRS